MIRIASETELKESFRNLDRDEVVVPPELKFPLGLKDYITWLEPSGHRVYLVFLDPKTESPIGVVFQRPHARAEGVNHMCEWCHSVRGSDAIGLLTARASRTRKVGLELCTDLRCKENIKALPGVHDFRERYSREEKLQMLRESMASFVRKNLV